MPTLAGRGFIFEGLRHTSYTVEYTENPDCFSHYTLPEILRLGERSEELSLEDLWQRGRRDLGTSEVTIEFSRDVIQKLTCPSCGEEEELLVPAGGVRFEEGRCRRDGHMRIVHTVNSYTGKEGYGDRSLAQMGLPRFDIFVARSAKREIGYLLEGDGERVLGRLAKGGARQ